MPSRRNRVMLPVVALALITAPGLGQGQASEAKAPSGSIDVHMHLGGDRGPGAGRPSGPRGGAYSECEEAAKSLVAQMDRYGVAKALLMPPPRSPDMPQHGELAALLGVSKSHAGRLFVAGGGDILNPMIQESTSVTPETRARFESEARKLLSQGVKAFGEMTALHLSFNPRHPFEQVPADHPLFLLLADIAAKGNVPIDLHVEAVTSDMPTPKGFASPNPATLKATIPSLEKLLAHNREARIVWQHVGWDNTGQMTLDLLRRLLKAHENLFMALRVEERTRGMDGSPMRNRIVDEAWKIRPDWRALLQEFPDRFVIGSDEFVGAPGASRRFPQSFEETWSILGQLSADLAAKIGRENARRIYGL